MKGGGGWFQEIEQLPQWAFHFLKCSMSNTEEKMHSIRCSPITIENLA
jgi:hypothetical protein